MEENKKQIETTKERVREIQQNLEHKIATKRNNLIKMQKNRIDTNNYFIYTGWVIWCFNMFFFILKREEHFGWSIMYVLSISLVMFIISENYTTRNQTKLKLQENIFERKYYTKLKKENGRK